MVLAMFGIYQIGIVVLMAYVATRDALRFGQLVERACNAHGMNDKEIADALGISRGQWADQGAADAVAIQSRREVRGASVAVGSMTKMDRPHDAYCHNCDMAEFAGITYEAAHTAPTSPNRCRCGVLVGVSHYCSLLGHAWVGSRETATGCLYHRDDPYPAGCADCADAVRIVRANIGHAQERP